MTVEEPPGRRPAGLDGGPLLVLARHAGPGDSFALVELLLSRYGRRPRIVLKEDLLWDPGLDVLLSRLVGLLPARAGRRRRGTGGPGGRPGPTACAAATRC